MPKVSVIVPNYNHERYLKARLDSILKQTFQDFEVIILDDCSTDNSKNVIELYRNKSSISHIVYNSNNSGSTFKQWSKGIDLAIGELIWIAESDDYCEPTFLEELLAAFNQDSSVVLAFCQSVVLNTDSKILYKTRSTFIKELMSGEEFLQRHMLGANHIVNASMALFRKETVSKVTVPFSEMRYGGDWFFWVNLCLFGKVYICGKYLNYYIRHDQSVAPSAVKRGYDFLEGNKVFEFIVKNITVSPENKVAALKVRCEMYLDRKMLFDTEQTHNRVLASMIDLDPSVKKMLSKLKARRGRKKIQLKLIKFLKKVLILNFPAICIWFCN